MKNLTDKEKWDLIDKVAEGFNNYPLEERRRMITYSTAAQLRTLMQAKSMYSNDMSPNLKRKITEWENSIAGYLEKYIKEGLE